MLDGMIAVPDEKGVVYITALRIRRSESLAYFAFDLLHLDGHDLRNCASKDRQALLRDVVGAEGCERIISVDYMTGNGAALFEAVRQIGPRASSRKGNRRALVSPPAPVEAYFSA